MYFSSTSSTFQVLTSLTWDFAWYCLNVTRAPGKPGDLTREYKLSPRRCQPEQETLQGTLLGRLRTSWCALVEHTLESDFATSLANLAREPYLALLGLGNLPWWRMVTYGDEPRNVGTFRRMLGLLWIYSKLSLHRKHNTFWQKTGKKDTRMNFRKKIRKNFTKDT